MSERKHAVCQSLDDEIPGREPDAQAGCFGFSFALRRRKTSDGYTRFEGSIFAPVRRYQKSVVFTVYLTDEERRRMAAALLEGIEA